MASSYRWLGVFVCLALAGCGANHDSIYRFKTLPSDSATMTAIDAKQRLVMTSPAGRRPQPSSSHVQDSHAQDEKASSGTTEPRPSGSDSSGDIVYRMRFCAEASPDVFSVLAQALSGDGRFGRSADPKAVQAVADFAYSSAEQGSTIVRTQTVSMLREVMYRTCERYLNGAISELEMPIQAVRDQRMMVATLAIEQLTNAARPAPTVIGASGTAGAGGAATDAVVRLDDAWKAFQSADTAQKQRKLEFDQLDAVTPSCSGIKKKTEAGATLEAAESTKQPDCSKAEAALAAAETQRQQASAHYETLKSATVDGGGRVSATTSTQAQVPATGDAHATGDMATVAAAVKEIVIENYNQDEFLLLCLKVLGQSKSEVENQEIRVECSDYVRAGIAKQSAQLKAEKLEFDARVAAVMERDTAVMEDRFEIFWAKVSSGNPKVLDSKKLKSVLDEYWRLEPTLGSDALIWRRTMEAAKTKDQLRSAFNKGRGWAQSDLAK